MGSKLLGIVVAALSLSVATAGSLRWESPVTAASAQAIDAAVAEAERAGAIARGEAPVADPETR